MLFQGHGHTTGPILGDVNRCFRVNFLALGGYMAGWWYIPRGENRLYGSHWLGFLVLDSGTEWVCGGGS